jgi:hypothetical protein
VFQRSDFHYKHCNAAATQTTAIVGVLIASLRPLQTNMTSYMHNHKFEKEQIVGLTELNAHSKNRDEMKRNLIKT